MRSEREARQQRKRNEYYYEPCERFFPSVHDLSSHIIMM